MGDLQMSNLTIYQDNYTDATVISNVFIDDYMKDANDAQLKVYLYLIRMMNAHMSTSISDIADKFNHTEKDVLRALKYWEKNKLLTLDYDESKNLSGIHLLDVSPKTATPVPAQTPLVVMAASKVLPAEAPAASPVEAAMPEPILYEKPSYSLDQLRDFKNNEETSQLLFVAEQYLGKTLSPSEIRTILFFSDKLGFSCDLIDYLIQYCVERGKKDFRYMEKVAITWAEANITTPKQAAKTARKYDKIVYDIMKALGKNNAPVVAEADYITKWTTTYGFTIDIIYEACERTVLATEKHRFEYADSILTNWYQKNVHHKADIKPLDDAFAKTKVVGTQAKVAERNKFNQFKQNSYDYEILEKEILSN